MNKNKISQNQLLAISFKMRFNPLKYWILSTFFVALCLPNLQQSCPRPEVSALLKSEIFQGGGD